MFWIELKLQKECSEQWVSDAWELLLMLLCDIASLIRLSITIQFTSTLLALETWQTVTEVNVRGRIITHRTRQQGKAVSPAQMESLYIRQCLKPVV